MAAPRLYKTEAIVLRQRKLGESDRILTLLTPTYGKVEAKARGVRKTSSRMAGHLQPLTRCLVQLAQGRSMEVVAGCQALESFRRLREDLGRLSRGLYAAELADRFLPERVEALAIYRLLLETLRRLEGSQAAGSSASSGQDPSTLRQAQGSGQDVALRYFEVGLLDGSGFRPELGSCLGCQRAIEALPAGRQARQNFFSPQSGGVICPDCAAGAAGSRVLSLNGLKILRLLQRGSYKEVAMVKLAPMLAQEVERHLRAYIVCVLERDLNAAAFIERLRREEAAAAVEV